MIIKINPEFHLDIGNITDVGRVREKNEDYLETFESAFGNVFIVCDGMGGHIAGEIASRLAVATIKEHIISNPEKINNTKQIIRSAIQLANSKIIEKWHDEPQLKGMGTTIVILIIRFNFAYYAHVGDSRIYIVRNKKIYQITKDQSFVQSLVDGGLISYKEAETHPRKNEITQALGISDTVKIDLNEIGLNLYKDDAFILCTDGLTGLVDDDIIQNIVIKNDAQDSCTKLVSLANNNGGHDNITIQIIRVIKGSILPKDKENIPPLGALNKNIHSVSHSFSSSSRLESTREIPEYDNLKNQKKKKMMPLYFGLIGLIVLFVALTFVFIKKDKNNEVVNKRNEKSFVKPTKEKINSIELTLKKYFDEFVRKEDVNEIKLDSLSEKLIEIKQFNIIDFDGNKIEDADKLRLKSIFAKNKISSCINCKQQTDTSYFSYTISFFTVDGINLNCIAKSKENAEKFILEEIRLEKKIQKQDDKKTDEEYRKKTDKDDSANKKTKEEVKKKDKVIDKKTDNDNKSNESKRDKEIKEEKNKEPEEPQKK